MKILLAIIICSFMSLSSFSQAGTTAPGADFAKLNWLIGDWKRTNTKPGRSGTERWVKISDTQLKGWGVSMKGSDTAYIEKLQLMVKDNHIYYVADVTDNKEPVYFTLTSITANSFECENPAHDFPKKIAYRLEGNTIKAAISGNGKSVEYMFEKK